MSAPDLSLERQKRRHHTMVKGIWWGFAIAAAVAIVSAITLTIA